MARDLDRNQDDYDAEMRAKLHDITKYQLFGPGGIGLPDPVGKQYRGQQVKAAQNQTGIASDAGPQGQKTMLFLHGMESRYGKTPKERTAAIAKTESQAKSYAEKRGMKFEALSISGDNHKAQQAAAQKRINQGGVGAVLGFSAGGYTASKLNTPKGVEKIIVGAPKAKGNQTFPGRHMDQVKGLAGSASGGKSSDYDYAAAKAAGVKQDARGHWPDTYKLPNHITFSNESKYSTPEHQGGQWKQIKGDHWEFTPGPENLKNHSPQELQKYFKQYEPKSKLILPQSSGPQSRYQPQPLPAGSSRPPADIPLARAGVDLQRVDPRLRRLMGDSIQLFKQRNPGYDVKAASGYRSVEQGSHPHSHGPHSAGKAMDLHIQGPNGPIHQYGSDPTGKYHELARIAYGQMQATQPDLKGKFAWGGAFGTQLGGGGPPDLEHFDLMNERGHITSARPSHMGALPGVQYGGQVQQASARSTFPPQPPAVNTGAQGAVNRAASLTTKMPTVGQLIEQNRNNPQFSQYAAYSSMIPDQNLPVDQWKQKHADLYNNPKVPQGLKSIFDNAMQTRPTAQPAQMSGVQQPSMVPQQQGPQSTAGNPLNVPKNLTPSEQRGISQFGSSLPRQPQQQQQFPPLPQPRPAAAPSMQDQAVNNIRPPDQQQPQPWAGWGRPTAGPEQPQPQPPTTMMPPTAGGQPNNAQPIMGGAPQPPQPPQPPPMPPPMPPQQPGLGAGTPFGGPQMGMGSPQASMGMSGPVVGGGDGMGGGAPIQLGVGGGGMGMGGGMFSGMGGGMGGGGDAGGGMGGGGRGGSKVNMQAAMQMIPKPIALPPLEGGIQPIQPGRAMPPQGQGGNMSIAQSIMQFLQGGEA